MKTKIWVVSFRKKSTKLKIRMYDCIPPTDEFDYLRPDGCIFVSIDRRYKVPLFDLRFDGWYENSVRLWPNHIEQNDCVLSLDNPLVIDTSNSSSNIFDDSSFDTVHWKKNKYFWFLLAFN